MQQLNETLRLRNSCIVYKCKTKNVQGHESSNINLVTLYLFFFFMFSISFPLLTMMELPMLKFEYLVFFHSGQIALRLDS